MVTTVESIRNMPIGSVIIMTARAAVSSRKMPAQSQVAPWKKRCRPRWWGGRLPQRDHFGGQPGDERVRALRRPGEQDRQAEVPERELQQEDPQFAGREEHGGLECQHDRGDCHEAGDASCNALRIAAVAQITASPAISPAIASAQPGGDCVCGDREPGRLGQAPRDGAQQPQRPGKFQVPGHGGTGPQLRRYADHRRSAWPRWFAHLRDPPARAGGRPCWVSLAAWPWCPPCFPVLTGALFPGFRMPRSGPPRPFRLGGGSVRTRRGSVGGPTRACRPPATPLIAAGVVSGARTSRTAWTLTARTAR